jgi:hypothetical protein
MNDGSIDISLNKKEARVAIVMTWQKQTLAANWEASGGRTSRSTPTRFIVYSKF